MNVLKERKRSNHSLDGMLTNYTVSGSNDKKIMYKMANLGTVSQHSSSSQNEWLKKTGISGFNLVNRTLHPNLTSLSDGCEVEYEQASVAFTERDDGTTDSSDGSYRNESQMTVNGGQYDITCKKDIECQTEAEPPKMCDVGKYMAAREMTPLQERMNALTVFPSLCYCFMVLLSGSWESKSYIEANAEKITNEMEFDDLLCINSHWLPHVHALPPAPVLAVMIGIICHGPFSFIYHWKYAHRLPPGLARTTHWSRRMDQGMLHFQSAFFSYATTGRLDFLLANVFFNMDCFYRQFLEEVRPRRNQTRIGISIAAYTLPLLIRGKFITFLKLCGLFGVGGWLFSQYPIGGWSHSVFHIVCTFVPPIMLATALDLSSSQSQLEVAARCAILAEDTLS